MQDLIKVLAKILTNILTALYEPFGFSLLLSFLAMFFYLYAYEPTAAGKGWKNAIVTWYQKFKESVFFRKLFLLAFVTSMILFRTLLNRNLWMNPLSDVMGGWGIWETVNGEQKLTTECIENVIMMVPFSAVVMWMPEKVSYVCTDPKGTIIIECGKMLSDAGYKIKVLNTINFKKSMHYNPFHYIRSEKDILKLVNTIIANTKGDGEKSGEDFWVKAERLLYCALIGYIYYEAPEKEQNFSTLLEFINASEAREDDEEFKNPVDELFEDLEKAKPEHFAVRQYKKYKLAAGDICSK